MCIFLGTFHMILNNKKNNTFFVVITNFEKIIDNLVKNHMKNPLFLRRCNFLCKVTSC